MLSKQFTARHRTPHLIYTDNSTNFKGAAHYLSFQANDVQKYVLNERITWNFNSPRAPHRGGVWEVAVKAMKAHLVHVTKNQVLTYDELTTIVTQIEGILHSRPLFEVLCPSHFLIGDSLTTIPETDQPPVKVLSYYQALRQRILSFWHQWSRDYLAQLRTQEKWQTASPAITIGDVVILYEDNTKPSEWPLGRVINVFPDAKGTVRTVEVFIRGSPKKRDISNVIRMPFAETISTSCNPCEGENMLG